MIRFIRLTGTLVLNWLARGVARRAATTCTLAGIAIAAGALGPVSAQGNWRISALPSSIRLDPSSGKVIEDRPDIYTMIPLGKMLEKNWVYDGTQVKLSSARGEYVSFSWSSKGPGRAI
jgi:hypothetical protein